VYVEGRSDRCFVEWIVSEHASHTVVYEIEDVEIPEEETSACGFENSNRGRCATLAKRLMDAIGDPGNPTIVIDGDYKDKVCEKGLLTNVVFWDSADPEMMCFSIKVLRKFFLVVCRVRGTDEQAFIECLTPIVLWLRCIRTANLELGWGMKWVSAKKFVARGDGGIKFDKEAHLAAYLQANGKWDKMAEFLQAVRIIEDATSGTPEKRGRGHDFFDLVECYLQSCKVGEHAAVIRSTIFVERGLIACLEMEEIRRSAAYCRLLQRVA
jgi:hypothetical protein